MAAWVVLISLVAIFQLRYLQFDLSADGMTIKGSAAEEFLQRVSDTFGAGQTTVIFFSDPELFTAEKLQSVRAVQQSLRQFSAAAIPLVTEGLSVLWMLGGMAAMGIPLNLMTALVPALLIIVGSTEDIHLLAEYQRGIQKGLSRPDAIRNMSLKMGLAIMLTFITTYLGFLSISLNQIELLKTFGLVAATGLLINFLLTVLLVPIFLSWFGCDKPMADGATKNENKSLITLFLGDIENLNELTCSTARRRMWTYVVFAIVAMAGLYGAKGLKVDNDPFAYFNPESEVVQRAEMLHQEISGVQNL